MRIDPRSDHVPFAELNIAEAHWQMGRYPAGLEAGRRAASGLPTHDAPYVAVAMNAIELRRVDETRAAIVEARRFRPNLRLALVQPAVARPDIDARRNAALRQAGLR